MGDQPAPGDLHADRDGLPALPVARRDERLSGGRLAATLAIAAAIASCGGDDGGRPAPAATDTPSGGSAQAAARPLGRRLRYAQIDSVVFNPPRGVVRVVYGHGPGERRRRVIAKRQGPTLVLDVVVRRGGDSALVFSCVSLRVATAGVRRAVQGHPRRPLTRPVVPTSRESRLVRRRCRGAPRIRPHASPG